MARAVSKPAVKEDIRQLSGAERSAVLLLALGDEHATKLWNMLDDEEIREISQIMSSLGSVSASVVEKLLVEFVSQMSGGGSLMGSYESTERLISRFLPGEKVSGAIQGPPPPQFPRSAREYRGSRCRPRC